VSLRFKIRTYRHPPVNVVPEIAGLPPSRGGPLAKRRCGILDVLFGKAKDRHVKDFAPAARRGGGRHFGNWGGGLSAVFPTRRSRAYARRESLERRTVQAVPGRADKQRRARAAALVEGLEHFHQARDRVGLPPIVVGEAFSGAHPILSVAVAAEGAVGERRCEDLLPPMDPEAAAPDTFILK
jgi:hypothetical protein